MDRRQQLIGWIAETERTQRRMAYVLAALVLVAIGLLVWRRDVGWLALFFVAAIGVIGYWVTYAHNAAHRTKLEELEREERRRQAGQGPQTSSHRRWRED